MILFFNDTTTTEIYTLSLRDALPIYPPSRTRPRLQRASRLMPERAPGTWRAWKESRHAEARRRRVGASHARSEEHTSELQSRQYLVCRLLLEKKKFTSTP